MPRICDPITQNADESTRKRRAFKLEQRILRLQSLLAKRRAELAQLNVSEPKRLFWVSFVDLSGDAVDIVVRGTAADDAYVVAARLLDDPRGNPMVFEVPEDLYHGPVCERLCPEQLEHVARLASGNSLQPPDPESVEPRRARSRKPSNAGTSHRGRT